MSHGNGGGPVAIVDQGIDERPMPTIRLATIEDFPAVVDGIEAMRNDTMWRHVAFQPDRVAAMKWLHGRLSTDGRYRLVVAEGPDGLVGLSGGRLAPPEFIPSILIVWEFAWWVHPTYRNSGVGWKMWSEIMHWARDQGAIGAVYGKSVCVPDIKVPRVFEKQIFMPLTKTAWQETT